MKEPTITNTAIDTESALRTASKKEMMGLFKKLSDTNTKIYLDTCFIMSPCFLDIFYPTLLRYNSRHEEQHKELKVYTPEICLSELRNNIHKSGLDPNIRTLTYAAYNLISMNESFSICESSLNYTLYDQWLLSEAIINGSRKSSEDMAIFTIDHHLSNDLLSLNDFHSINVRKPHIYAITQDNYHVKEVMEPYAV